MLTGLLVIQLVNVIKRLWGPHVQADRSYRDSLTFIVQIISNSNSKLLGIYPDPQRLVGCGGISVCIVYLGLICL